MEPHPLSPRLVRGAAVLALLLPSLVLAQDTTRDPTARWGVFASAGAGLFLGLGSGYVLDAHLMLVTPMGLEAGLLVQSGATFSRTDAYLRTDPAPGEVAKSYPFDSFRGVGLEARYRFLRDRRLSPWVALRIGRSTSSTIDTDAGQPWKVDVPAHLSWAIGGGLDAQVAGPLGLNLAAYYQRCDIDTRAARVDTLCGPGPTLVLSPRLRF